MQIPYALLLARCDYPEVLRRPTAEVLTRFHAAGPSLVLTWLAFAWSGAPLLLALPMAPRALGLERDAWVRAATAVGFAGLVVQIVGLLRWVVHAYGGVAIGEHLGMALSCLWMAALSWGPAGLVGSLLWLGWMAALGVGLVRSRPLGARPRTSAVVGALGALLLVAVACRHAAM